MAGCTKERFGGHAKKQRGMKGGSHCTSMHKKSKKMRKPLKKGKKSKKRGRK